MCMNLPVRLFGFFRTIISIFVDRFQIISNNFAQMGRCLWVDVPFGSFIQEGQRSRSQGLDKLSLDNPLVVVENQSSCYSFHWFYPRHWLLSYKIFIDAMVRAERGVKPVKMNNINPQKRICPTCSQILWCLTHYHTIPHVDALKINSYRKQCEKRRNCL